MAHLKAQKSTRRYRPITNNNHLKKETENETEHNDRIGITATIIAAAENISGGQRDRITKRFKAFLKTCAYCL